ncbi:MAG: aminotransferase class IV [bacterium]
MIVYLNGNFKALEKAHISPLDHSFLYGDGVFETIRAYKGKIFKLDEHIERLKNAISILEIKIPKIDKKNLYQLLSLNNLKDAIIRITISRGEGQRGIDPALCKKPNIVVITEEFRGFSKKCVSATILDIRRQHPKTLPSIKSNNYLPNILAKIEAKKKGVDEGIFLTIDGYVACGITSNIFIYSRGKLITPPLSTGILPGITRKVIIEIASSIGIPVLEKRFRKPALFEADCVFLTSTGYEIMPIARIDNCVYKIPQALVDKLLSLFREKACVSSFNQKF